MGIEPSFDVAAGHRWLAAHCFNAAWELIDLPARTEDQTLEMISRSHASLYHWSQRADCTAQHRSVGHWQLSRVYALAGSPQEAARHAEACLRYSEGLEPFYVGFAYEALARARHVANDGAGARGFVTLARAQAALVDDAEHRAMLERDLEGLGA